MSRNFANHALLASCGKACAEKAMLSEQVCDRHGDLL